MTEGPPEEWGAAGPRQAGDPPLGTQDPGPLTVRRGLTLAVVYAIASVAFAGAAVAIELAFGHALAHGHGGDVARSLEDAAWHLGTGLAIALPTRRRVLCLVLPLMTLGIDADHVFGGLLPTVVGRESHSLIFLVLVTAVFALIFGRDAGLLATSATLLHLGVDGGSFPLLAPASAGVWPLPFGVAVLGIAAAGGLALAVGRSPRDLFRLSCLVPAAVAVSAVVVAGFLIPWVQVFNGS